VELKESLGSFMVFIWEEGQPRVRKRAPPVRPSGQDVTMPLNRLPAAPIDVVMRSRIRAHQRHHVIRLQVLIWRRIGGRQAINP
jgi:hypothetical protein